MSGTAELVRRLADAVGGTSAPLDETDGADLGEMLPLIQRHAQAQGLLLDEDRMLAVATHALAFVRRVRAGEHLDPLDAELYEEVPRARFAAARELIDSYCIPRGHTAPDSEVLLLALHFEVALHHASQADPTTRGARS